MIICKINNRIMVKGKKELIPLSELKKPRENDTLEDIVKDYCSRPLICYGDLEKFVEIVDCICGKIGNPFEENGRIFYRRCRHQAHMNDIAIEEATKELKKIEGELKEIKDFEKLHERVNKVNIKGFGPLAKYDFCVRFGYKYGVKPEKFVYLHAGTKEGAKSLKRLIPELNPREYEEKMPIELLPKVLKELGSIDIENLLCIFKERLSTLKKI